MIWRIKYAWANRRNIFEGFWNSLHPSEHVEQIAARRTEICEADWCGMYDPDGSSEKAYFKGKPACAGCGCVIAVKVRSLSSECTLAELGLKPLWKAEMSQDEEDAFRKKHKLEL
jgi:hypothetical protein